MVLEARKPVSGHRHPPHPARRRRQGHRPGPVRRRRAAARHAARQGHAQPARPRPHHRASTPRRRWRCPASRRSSPQPTSRARATASPSWARAPINLRAPERELPRRASKVLYRGHAVAAVAATDAAHRRGRPRADRGRVRGAAAGARRARGDARRTRRSCTTTCARRDAARPSTTRDKPTQHRRATSSSRRRRRSGLRRGRRRHRARVHDRDVHQGYIEPHNAHRDLERRRPRSPSGPAPRALRRPRRRSPSCCSIPVSQDQGRADGDRRRLRRQDPRLPRAARGAALEEDRQAREDDDDPRRGLRGHRPDLRHATSASRSAPRRTARSSPPRRTWPTRPAPIPGSPVGAGA